VLARRVLGPDQWCRRCGCEGVARDTVTRQLAYVPLGWRPTTLIITIRRYRCTGGDARDQLRASDPAAVDVGETRQLTLNLNPGDNCFVVCGGAPCPAIVQAEFVQERCRSARSKEVTPIFVHSRVLTPSRWSH